MPAPKEPSTKWGKWLREWRKDANLTQDELSEKSGVAQTVISAIESGRVLEPEFATWEKLCAALGKKALPEEEPTIPVFAFVAAGDHGLAFTDQGYGVGDGMYRIKLPPGMRNNYALALEVRGNSMAPKYEAGQIVIADTTKEPGNGDCAVVGLAGGERFIKRWRRKGSKVYLESVNPEYGPLEVPSRAVKFAYKIVWVLER